MASADFAGGCQCGAVRFQASGVDLEQTIACNCSRCGKLGLVLSFVPEESFTLVSGGGSLTEFQFNKHVIRHLFCKVCGVQAFARGIGPGGKPMAAVNVRCLDAVDVHDLHPRPHDGRAA